MHKLTVPLTFLGLLFIASACTQQPTGPAQSGSTLPMTTGSTSAATPAIAYRANTAVKSKGVTETYSNISVMDSDGTHQTVLVTAPNDINSETYTEPYWSPGGGSILYRDVETSSATGPTAIKAFDVSLSNGVPVASNKRTVYSLVASDSEYIATRPAWCSTTSTAKIAFIRAHTGSQSKTTDLCTIGESGGSVTVLTSFQGYFARALSTPAWSPDDSKIAVIRGDTVGHITIMVFNASTGAALDSIPFSSIGNMGYLQWSRTGLNELVFSTFASGTSGPYVISYCAPTTGATPASYSVQGDNLTWSPNNSSVLYLNQNTHVLGKNVAQSGTTSTVLSSFYGLTMNWKR